MDILRTRLEQGAEQLGLDLSEEQITQLLAYLALLVKWNKAYNLTAVRDPEEMVSRHLLDSLAVVPHLQGKRVLDVGSGAGLPGIPLAIIYPERTFSLLDSNGKKSRFQMQAKAELKLDNLTVLQARVEQLEVGSKEVPERFDCITSRAFSSLELMVTSSQQLLAEGGHWLAMKGLYPEQELVDLEKACPEVKLLESITLDVPGCDGQRHLLRLK